MNNCNVLSEKTPESYLLVDSEHVTTNSTNVADIFSKRHNHVVTKIKALECSEEFRSTNFLVHPKTNPQNGEKYDTFQMTKNGFIFLVMGYTGRKAAQIKEAYICAFDLMAEKLQAKKTRKTLTSEQCLHVRERVSELVHAFKDTNFKIQYGKINREFNKNSYKDILASDYPKVCRFLNCLPRVDLQTKPEPVQNVQQLPMPFLNERILFEWRDGELVSSRPIRDDEIISTKERILKLVTYPDFTTPEERYTLTEQLNADLLQYTKDLRSALKTCRSNAEKAKH